MTVGDLIRSLEARGPVPGGADTASILQARVAGVAYDSRRVTPGELFVAVTGYRTDGLAFASEACGRGALAVVAEAEPVSPLPVPVFIVPDARQALARMAAEFYEHPSRELPVFGVTGTNGKTTTAYLVAAIFDRAGIQCGRIGTVSYRVGGAEQAAPFTTPEAPGLQRLLRTMVDQGCGACVMEVSSHALALRRVEATRFAAAIFTNLTREHLDFHGDMSSYMDVKRGLFQMLPAGGVAVVNVDDSNGRTLLDHVARPVTFGIDEPADVAPVGPISSTRQGLSFEIETPRGRLQVRSRLLGHPNVYNILAAVALGTALDLPLSTIEEGVRDLEGVPGRFQLVSAAADPVTVLVDYAHTDDALKNLLKSGRRLTSGRVILVFGCGGDRDRTKRPLMGAVASRLSDLVVVTSDNPRSEDPDTIMEEIARGMTVPASDRDTGSTGRAEVLTIADRATAINRAIGEARDGDVVLIAGKGHERHQEIRGRRVPLDDVEVARASLADRRLNSHVM